MLLWPSKAAFISEGNSQINLLSILEEVPHADTVLLWWLFDKNKVYFRKDHTAYYAISLAINNSN